MLHPSSSSLCGYVTPTSPDQTIWSHHIHMQQIAHNDLTWQRGFSTAADTAFHVNNSPDHHTL